MIEIVKDLKAGGGTAGGVGVVGGVGGTFDDYDEFGKKANDESVGVTLDDIWDQTQKMSPNLLKFLDDYDPWENNEIRPLQKPLTEEDEEDYKRKMKYHLRRRQQMMDQRYPFPTWCKYIVWVIGFIWVFAFLMAFLYYGNLLGATFTWTPYLNYDPTTCSEALNEETQFAYAYRFVLFSFLFSFFAVFFFVF